ncbi:MAG: lysophospholipid acyltransferase family protein [Elusimicrobiota bacterium]|nr:lysophospholipid acyltransferase family protein [Elusimicrobiota bacterium]
MTSHSTKKVSFHIFVSLYFYLILIKIFLSAYFKIIFHQFNWQIYVEYSKKIVDLVRKFGTKVYIEGEQILATINRPVVIISNHMSSLETFIFGYIFGRFFSISFIVKKSLIYYPFFGRILRFLNPIVVSRKDPKKDYDIVKTQAEKLIKNGVSIIIFPQATRSYYIDVDKFSSLGVKLAKKFQLDILPVCVKTDFLKIGRVWKEFGKVQPENDVFIKIFSPIPYDSINKTTNKEIALLFRRTLSSLN